MQALEALFFGGERKERRKEETLIRGGVRACRNVVFMLEERAGKIFKSVRRAKSGKRSGRNGLPLLKNKRDSTDRRQRRKRK